MIQQSATSVVKAGNSALRNGHDRSRHIRECCQTLLHRLPWPGKGAVSPLRALGITSCRQGEGVSTISSQLAATAASWSDYRILLVDTNVAEPSVHELFNVSLHPGWANIFQDGEALDKHIQSTSISNLSVLAAGSQGAQTMSADVDLELTGLLKELATDYDLAIFDLPPVGQSNEAARLAALLDGVVLVVEAEVVHSDEVRRASELLTRFGARFLGVVLNKVRQPMPQWLARAL